jgi:hypothetical protein
MEFAEYEMFPPEGIRYCQEKAEQLPAFKKPILGYLWTTYSVCLSLSFPELFETQLEKAVPDDDRGRLWKEVSNSSKIKGALLLSQPAALISLLEAYECFICLTLKIAYRLQKMQVPKGTDFEDVFELCFSKEALLHCWTNAELQGFFKVREALLNSGGMVSVELQELLQGTEMVKNNHLDIRKSDNEYLWAVLTRGITFLIEFLSNNYKKMIENYPENEKFPLDITHT